MTCAPRIDTASREQRVQEVLAAYLQAVDNGSAPHSPVHYLGKIAVGRAISEALG